MIHSYTSDLCEAQVIPILTTVLTIILRRQLTSLNTRLTCKIILNRLKALTKYVELYTQENIKLSEKNGILHKKYKISKALPSRIAFTFVHCFKFNSSNHIL